MASPLDSILDVVKRKVAERVGAAKPGAAGGGLLGQITDMLGQRAGASRSGKRDVRPASQDPYGDPADQPGGNRSVKPASQDPYGDPADQK